MYTSLISDLKRRLLYFFLEMLAMVVSECSFVAYVFLRRPAGIHRDDQSCVQSKETIILWSYSIIHGYDTAVGKAIVTIATVLLLVTKHTRTLMHTNMPTHIQPTHPTHSCRQRSTGMHTDQRTHARTQSRMDAHSPVTLKRINTHNISNSQPRREVPSRHSTPCGQTNSLSRSRLGISARSIAWIRWWNPINEPTPGAISQNDHFR